MTTNGGIWHFAWVVFWRTAVAGILLGVVVSMVLSFILPSLFLSSGMSPETMLRSVTWIAYAASAVAYFVVLKFVLESLLGKNIGGVCLDYASRTRLEEASLAH